MEQTKPSQPPPLHYLRWCSGMIFVLSVGAAFYAGLLFSEMQGVEAREVFAREGVFPQEFWFSMSLLAAVGFAVLAGVIYVGAVLTERLMDLR